MSPYMFCPWKFTRIISPQKYCPVLLFHILSRGNSIVSKLSTYTSFPLILPKSFSFSLLDFSYFYHVCLLVFLARYTYFCLYCYYVCIHLYNIFLILLWPYQLTFYLLFPQNIFSSFFIFLFHVTILYKQWLWYTNWYLNFGEIFVHDF